MERRRLLQLAGAFLAAGSAPGALFAQTTQMTMVVPFPPGGGGDILARTVSLPFSEALREKVVLFNRPGAGGNIGTGQVVKSQPDGTTIGYVTNGIMCVNPYLYDRQSFDPLKDLTPVAGLTSIGLVLAVSPKALPDVHTAADLVKHAQARPGETAFASAGPGTTSHLAGILLCCFTKDRSGCSGARGRTGGALSGSRSLSEITNKSRSPHRDEKSAFFGGLVGASDGGNYAALKPVFNSQQTDLLTRVIRK